MSTPPDGEREYTIDQLAAASGVPSRTIRFYQSKGVLRRPTMKGRVAYYGQAHLELLEQIATLQDRGLRIDAIRELVARLDKGELDLNEWLGLDAQLQASWAPDAPRTMSEAELRALAGPKRPGMIAALTRAGLVERQGSAYLVPSPALLQVALKLDTAGVGPEITQGAEEILRKHLSRATDELAKHFLTQAKDGFGHDARANDLPGLFHALRTLGPEAVRIIFAQEMEKVLRKLSESGVTATLPVTRKKKTKPA